MSWGNQTDPTPAKTVHLHSKHLIHCGYVPVIVSYQEIVHWEHKHDRTNIITAPHYRILITVTGLVTGFISGPVAATNRLVPSLRYEIKDK